MSDSVFTKIIKHELPAEVLHEDERFIVILSIAPHNPGHSLVIPKVQSDGNFWDMNPDSLSDMVILAQKVSKVLFTTLKPVRIGLLFEGFGVTDHVHINLIPINKPGDLDHDMAQSVTPEELHKIAEQLKPALKQAGL